MNHRAKAGQAYPQLTRFFKKRAANRGRLPRLETLEYRAMLSVTTYTSDADFDQGTSTNLNHDAPGSNQLQLNEEIGAAFPFIWIAASDRGTIVKINTETGDVLGEYSTSPDTIGFPNPSRTTVSLDGSVWAGNRNAGSVIHVGLKEANQCVDRNNNGTIETSAGYGDVLAWPNAGGVDSDGGVETALDECILHFTTVSASATRHVSVDANNDVWVSGRFGSNDAVFDLVDGDTGQIVRTEGPFNAGGYGGLIDGDGVVWSASSSGSVLRWDPDLPIDATNPKYINIPNYGMAADGFGNIWVTELSGGNVRKLAPDGTVLGTFPYGSANAQGLAIDNNNHVWVSSSLFGGTTVGHLLNDGTFIGNVTGTGIGSTGVAVDAAGKIWTANINSSDATRIDPAAGPVGADGVTPIGAVDLTVPLPGANPYNYSDMTGQVALGQTSPQGTWTVVEDSDVLGAEWGRIQWNQESAGLEPEGSSITVEARAADTEAGLGGQAYVPVANGSDFDLIGRFLQVRVTLKPNEEGQGPILSDITIATQGDEGPTAGICGDYVLVREGDLPFVVSAEDGVLADQDNGTIAVLVEGPKFGDLTLNPDGSFSYMPHPNFRDFDTFRYLALTEDETEVEAALSELSNGELGVTVKIVSSDYAWLCKLYQDVLGRPGSDPEIVFYGEAIRNGVGHELIVPVFQNSVEYRTRGINELYQELLGRPVDSGGLSYWLAATNGPNGNLETVRVAILSSGEYYQNSGGTNAGFITSLYQDLFERAPAPAEITYWEGVLNAGATRRAVVVGFTESTESRSRDIRDMYETYLRRTPGPSELDFWLNFLASGGTRKRVQFAILASQEYFGY